MDGQTQKAQKEHIPLIDFLRFRGKEVAVVEGEVVAVGKSSKEVFDKAKKLFPMKSAKDILLFSVPKEKVFIYSLE